jgi:hypothetical protein
MGIKLQAGSKFSAGMKLSIPNAGWSMIVGAGYANNSITGADDRSGRIYLIKETGEQVLLSVNSGDYDAVGLGRWQSATNGDIIVVGHDTNDDQGNNAGAVYIFNSTGQLLYTHYDSTPVSAEYFGRTIALSQDGSKIALRTYKPNYDGMIVLMDIDGSNRVEINNGPSGTGGWGGIGFQIGFTANKLIVNAKTGDGHSGVGEVYIYNLDGSLSNTITSPLSGDFKFGNSIAVDQQGSKFVVSSPLANGSEGVLYVYEETGTLLHTITSSGSSRLGYHLAYGSGKIAALDYSDDWSFHALRIWDEDGSNEIVKTKQLPTYQVAKYFTDSFVDLTVWSGALSIFGNTIAAGAVGYFQRDTGWDYYDPASNTAVADVDKNGAVYLYDLDGTNERKIVSNDPNIVSSTSFYMPNFGSSIAGYQQASPAAPATQLPYVAPPSAPSAPTPNKILMYSTTNMWNASYNNIRGGLVMSDVDGSNPITLQTLTPQSSAGGEGKVVSITRSNSEIRIYDQTTGQLEQTFNDATVDSAMAAQINETAKSIAIGAGKIFINAYEYYPNGLGAIIVVDLLDRNVPTYVITPVVSGTYSRIGTVGGGGLRFLEGRIYAGSEQWDATARGIHGFDVDGSNQTFIPTSHGLQSFVKFGDNWAASSGDYGVEILSSTGQVLHTANVSAQYGYSLETTLSGKLVVVDHTQFNSKVYIYDEGLTNQVVISGDQQANDDLWGDGSVVNRTGMAVFGNDILVSAKNADANGLTNCGAVYRYNDSGVLQDIVYGTVDWQVLGQRIEVAY